MPLKFRNAPASSVATPAPSATALGAKPLRSSRQFQNEPTVRISQENVSDPSHHNRALNDIQTAVDRSTRAMRTSPLLPGVLFPNTPMTANVTKVLAHNLYKPYRGAWIINTTTFARFRIVSINDASMPAGLNVSQHIGVQTDATGNFDIYVC